MQSFSIRHPEKGDLFLKPGHGISEIYQVTHINTDYGGRVYYTVIGIGLYRGNTPSSAWKAMMRQAVYLGKRKCT